MIRPDLPESQVRESMALEARGIVQLFQVDLFRPNGEVLSLFLCPRKTEMWQGKTWYDDIPCNISESSFNVSGETSRPKFSIVNPNGTWSRYVHQKYTDNAIVTRYRVLRPDLDQNNNSYQLNLWKVSKVISLNKDMVVFELRGILDGARFKIPAETYRPPKYPTVSVQ